MPVGDRCRLVSDRYDLAYGRGTDAQRRMSFYVWTLVSRSIGFRIAEREIRLGRKIDALANFP